MFCRADNFMAIVCGIGLLVSISATNPAHIMEKKPEGSSQKAAVAVPITENYLENLLKQYPQYFDTVLQHRKDWNVQIIYTQIDRNSKGSPNFKTYDLNVDKTKYFYPASTVKLPVCLLALQKLNELKATGINKNTTMVTESEYSGQTAVYNDASSIDGRPSIAHYIKKILMVSDNDAFNRLYEFLGQEYINNELHRRGYDDVQLLHRLNIFLTEDENRHTNPVKFLDDNGKVLYQQPMQASAMKYAQRSDSIGKAYYSGSKLVDKPMDFSKKNRISLWDLNTILQSLVFPEKVPAAQRFNLTEEDRQFLLKYMSQYPTESTYPPYSADTSYFPAYSKFILFGADRSATEQTPGVRIFSKSGDAYGQMIDVTYVTDQKNGVEFFLSAVIYCNSDNIMNDDKYDYDKIGLPFLKHLGEVIYRQELKRKKKVKPDLSNFIFQYNKS